MPHRPTRGNPEEVATRRSARFTPKQLAQLTPAELRREARRLVRRFEPRPKAEAQRRAVDEFFARAEPIKRRLQRLPRKQRGEDLGELERRADSVLERLR